MKIISLNIEKDLHNEVVLRFLKNENPDIVCLQEFLEENLELYKRELGMDAMYQTCRREISNHYPKHIGKKQGIVIFAKNIIDKGYYFYVGKEEYTTKPFNLETFQTSEALIWTDIKSPEGKVFRIVTMHLPVTSDGSSTAKQLDELGNALTKLDQLGEFILCGDMNAPRIHETFQRITKKYKDNIPSHYETSLDINLHRVGEDKFITEDMDHYVVDGLFTTPRYKASNVRLVDGLSDHMAIVGDIEME